MKRNRRTSPLIGVLVPIVASLFDGNRQAYGFSARPSLPSPLITRSDAYFSYDPTTSMKKSSQLFVSKITSDQMDTSKEEQNDENSNNGRHDHGNIELSDDDKALLKQTPKSQLEDLCTQFHLNSKGSKAKLLLRLRNYAEKASIAERKRREELKRQIEEGSDDDREKYKLVGDDDDDEDDVNEGGMKRKVREDEDDFYIYVESKDPALEAYRQELQENSDDGPTSRIGTRESTTSSNYTRPPGPITQATLTAPPPPDVEPDENGERVVTVYSTTDHNDLTGVASAQPGQSFANDPMTGTAPEPQDAPWNMGPSNGNTGASDGANKKTVSSSEIESAKEVIIEVVSTLLAISGAPGFQNDDFDDDMEDDDDDNESMYESLGLIRKPKSMRGDRNAFTAPEGFVGFDPAQVPAHILTESSASLRMGRGEVLRDVIRDFEVRAIGYDGPAGDNKDRGGGHYRQVSLVRTFLEGYRRAEEGRIARETASMLLNKLVSEGIEGLDETLSSMTRADSKASQEAGELNDALLDYLNDLVRQQEKKVSQFVDSVKKVAELENAVSTAEPAQDEIEELWTVDEVEGKAVQTFDPKDPKSKKALEAEYARVVEQQEMDTISPVLPKSTPEKILLLLKVLRERIKVEAAFSNDEKSQNLRILAYCLKLPNDQLRKDLIVKEFGSSLDRLDSFAELVASSIEYGESASYQLKPTKSGSMLNLTLLRRIQNITKDINKNQTRKASGGMARP